MALPTTGALSASQINVELGRASSAVMSMNGSDERGLAERPSGVISFQDFRGKSSAATLRFTVGRTQWAGIYRYGIHKGTVGEGVMGTDYSGTFQIEGANCTLYYFYARHGWIYPDGGLGDPEPPQEVLQGGLSVVGTVPVGTKAWATIGSNAEVYLGTFGSPYNGYSTCTMNHDAMRECAAQLKHLLNQTINVKIRTE